MPGSDGSDGNALAGAENAAIARTKDATMTDFMSVSSKQEGKRAPRRHQR